MGALEAWPASSQIDAIVDTLKGAGMDMQEDQDFEKGYAGSYDNNGTKMKITVSETGSGKHTVHLDRLRESPHLERPGPLHY